MNGVNDTSVPPSFMLNDWQCSYIGCRTICRSDSKKGSLYIYQISGRVEQIVSDMKVANTITNQIEINCYILMQSHDETAMIWEKIKERLVYLDGIFDEEENMGKYQSTKKLLLEVLRCFRLRKQPLIGIDDNGQIGASWHNGLRYKIISIVPRHENNISVSCITNTNKMLREKTTLPQIKSNGIKELTRQIMELPW